MREDLGVNGTLEKDNCRVFKAGQHGKEWRVRASSNGNKVARRKKPTKTSMVRHDYVIMHRKKLIVKTNLDILMKLVVSVPSILTSS